MMPDPSSAIHAQRIQQLSIDHDRLDGPVPGRRAAAAGRARTAATGRRWRFGLLRARAA
jgi:hypothetical protein